MKKPEKSVDNFLRTWKKKDFSEMENFIQKTWLAGTQLMSLDIFKNLDVRSWKIQKSVKIGEACKDVIVNVTFKQNGKRKLNIRTLCEIAPYTPDLSGDWGVNPVSVMRRL